LVSPDSSFNTAVSFASNTNWQGYGGEATMSYLTQMRGLGVQNFLAAASGMAVLVALIRGFTRRQATEVGNLYVDFTRSTLYILVPLSLVLAIILVSQGLVQSFSPSKAIHLLEPVSEQVTQQTIPLGPAASQVAIKQLGTNDGGFFNANSAHPLENPTPLSNFLQVLAILLIPAALCYTFGSMVGDTRQGWAVLAVLFVHQANGSLIVAGERMVGSKLLGQHFAGAGLRRADRNPITARSRAARIRVRSIVPSSPQSRIESGRCARPTRLIVLQYRWTS
jgi:K+-transporting ATPase ATPase A chain